MEDIFFVDKNGKKIFSEEISSHIALGNLVIQKDEQLKKEYEESGKRDVVDFLISDKGYLKVTNIDYYYSLVFSASKISKKQKEVVRRYGIAGYRLDDLDKKKQKNNEEYIY